MEHVERNKIVDCFITQKDHVLKRNKRNEHRARVEKVMNVLKERKRVHYSRQKFRLERTYKCEQWNRRIFN